MFSRKAVSIYIPSYINSVQESPFSTFSSVLVNFCYFDNSHSNGYEVISCSGFYLHFPDVVFLTHTHTNGMEEAFGSDGYIYETDDDFMGVSLSSNSHNCIH